MVVEEDEMTVAEQVIVLAEREPGLNLTEVSRRVGVTREYVRQLANKHNLPFYRGAHRKPRTPCWVCGKPASLPKNLFHLTCVQAFNATPVGQARIKARNNFHCIRWQRNNREYYSAYRREYYRRNAEKLLAYGRAWRRHKKALA